MKSTVMFILLAVLSFQVASAQESNFPMNGEYKVLGASKINIQCRSLATFDSLGQTTISMTVVSDETGVTLYDADGRLKASFLVENGYKYFDKNQVLAKGRSILTMDGKSLYLDGGRRLPTDIGFGPMTCEYPKK